MSRVAASWLFVRIPLLAALTLCASYTLAYFFP